MYHYARKSNIKNIKVNPIDNIYAAEIIESNDGKVLEQGLWQKRKLAYSIDGHKEAIYTITTFEGSPTIPSEIDRVLKISDDVIRHKVLKVES